MKKIVLVSFLIVTSGFSDNVNTGNKSPVQMGNTPTVNYNPTIYNISVRTPEEAVRLQQALAKTPKPIPPIPTKTVVPPKAPVPKPQYVAPPQPSNSVYDRSTGLQWQDNSDAKTVKKDWEGAKSYCANLTLDSYSDWRLPSYPELLTIVDYTKYKPAIKTGFKNTTTNGWYWSASPYVYYDSYAWVVDFSGGFTGNDSKTVTNYVRCVRGRQ